MEILTQEQALAIYRQYLATKKLDHKNEVCRPCKEAIARAMYRVHSAQKVSVSDIIQAQVEANKRVLFWSDQHFNHHNIIRYSSRPFQSTTHMNNTMLSNYYNVVQEDDLVVFGGDIAFGEIEKVQPLLAALPGKKVLIIGNHDFNKNQLIFRDFGIFEAVAMSAAFHWIFDDKIYNILLSHYPIDNHYLPKNTLNVHGHIHQYQADVKNINICVEHTNFTPVDIREKVKSI